jgi:hypothetical protein
MDKLRSIHERKKIKNGNEQRNRSLAKLVLSRSFLIMLLSKVNPNQNVLKMNSAFRDETAKPVNGYRPIIFSEVMEICFILNQRPNEHEEKRIIVKEIRVNFLFDQRK